MRPAVLAALLLAAGCATAPPPGPGQPIRLEVLRGVGPEPSEQRPLRAMLAAGLPEAAVRDGRLATFACAEAMPGGGRREATFWALFPPGEAAPRDHGHGVVHAFTPGARLGEAAAPGAVLSRLREAPPLVETAFGAGLTRRLPACESATPGQLQGQLGLVASTAQLAQITQEDAWRAALPQAAMREGRIVMARCASARDEVRLFYAEAPPGPPPTPGTVLGGIAGAPADGVPGPIARLSGPVPAAPVFLVRSSSLVRCDAPVSTVPRG